MELIDIILGGLLAYGLIKGLIKGLFVELASVVALMAGLFMAVKFSGAVGNMLGGTLGAERKGTVAAFVLTFIAVVVGIYFLAKAVTKMAQATGLGWVNRLLGGVFGCIKMALLLSVALNFFVKVNSGNAFAQKKTLDNSIFFYPVLQVSNLLFPVLKEWFTDASAQAGKPAATTE